MNASTQSEKKCWPLPLATLGIERLLITADIICSPDAARRIEQFERGLSTISQLKRERTKVFLNGRHALAIQLGETILAVELDQVLETLLSQENPKSVEGEIFSAEQQIARHAIAEAWNGHLARYASHAVDLKGAQPLRVPDHVKVFGETMIGTLAQLNDPVVRGIFSESVELLGETEGAPALEKSVFYLQAILSSQLSTWQNILWAQKNHEHPIIGKPFSFSAQGAVVDFARLKEMITALHSALSRSIIRLYAMTVEPNPESSHALAILQYLSGQGARTILNELEPLLAGRSAYSVWTAGGLATNFSDSASRHWLLSMARTIEAQAGAVDGRPYPQPPASDPGRPMSTHEDLPVESVKQARPLEQTVKQLLAGLLVDPRSQCFEVEHAVLMANLLAEHEKIDLPSMLDWVQALYGVKQAVDSDQLLGLLQEATAAVLVIMTLKNSRKLMFSREHCKDRRERLGASFDLWIVDVSSNAVVEVVEIKKTSRPYSAKDLASILSQATGKLDREVHLLTEVDRENPVITFHPPSVQRLRNIQARKSLVIQIPWERECMNIQRGGVTISVHPNGMREVWRPAEGREKGVRLEEGNLFSEIADYLAAASDVSFFDFIALTDTFGMPIVYFHQELGADGSGAANANVQGRWRPESLRG